MEGNKTGALLACAASSARCSAARTDRPPTRWTGTATTSGLAFQAVDDLLGIWGDPEADRQAAWSDLRQRKKSLPVVCALTAGGPAVRASRGAVRRPRAAVRGGRSRRAG